MKKIILFFAIILIMTRVHAQHTPAFTLQVNHLALSVKDLNRSVEFYTTVFQLPEITNRTANPNIRWLSMNEGKELHLLLNTEPVALNKSVHPAFSASNLDAFIKHLTDLKIPYSDWVGKPNAINLRADGIKQIYLQDPDGYWIEVNNAAQ